MSLLNPAAPRQGWFNVTLLGFAHFVSDFFSNVLPVMLPILAARFSLSYSQCAVVFMVFSVTMNLIQPPIGLMADRFRVNILMPLSVVSGALLACLLTLPAPAQDRSLNRYKEYAYTGEWDTRNPDRQALRIIKDGQVDFEFVLPLRDPWDRVLEFDDVRILPDGNILYAAMSQLGLINRKGEHLWKYICPQGTESHSCQPLAPDLVYFALNGNPGKIVIWNTLLDKCVREIPIESQTRTTHGQFRHVRRTPEGDFVLGLMQEQEILEISPEGEVLKRIPNQFCWHVDKLPDGHYLIGGDSKHYVRELDGDGKTIWEVTQADLPFHIGNLQTATRLQNGNTLICSWIAGHPEAEWKGTVQFFEITPSKEVVWQVSSWENPDLGPCTYLDIVSEPDAARGVDVLRPRHADGTYGSRDGNAAHEYTAIDLIYKKLD